MGDQFCRSKVNSFGRMPAQGLIAVGVGGRGGHKASSCFMKMLKDGYECRYRLDSNIAKDILECGNRMNINVKGWIQMLISFGWMDINVMAYGWILNLIQDGYECQRMDMNVEQDGYKC